MLLEVDMNKELMNKYSKYEVVNLALLILKNEEKEKEKEGKRIILTDLVDEVINKLSLGKYSEEYIDALLSQNDSTCQN